MLRRMIGPVVFGFGGLALLIALGLWQVARLEWKSGIIADIEARIQADPVSVPANPDPDVDQYLPVLAQGSYTGEVIHVLSSQFERGTGSHVIGVLQTPSGRRLLVDRGFIAEGEAPGAQYAGSGAAVSGNLLWPDDADSFTPDPDLGRNLWFSRRVAPMAAHLGTDAVLIVARSDAPTVPGLVPTPLDSADIRNNHLGYAVTWFSLALVWAVMTAALVWRIWRDKT